jgi:galactose oxidase
VNGNLVYTNNVGSLAFSRSASSSVNAGSGSAQIPGTAFTSGPNVVAVMVKQIGGTSPDLLFGLQLVLSSP